MDISRTLASLRRESKLTQADVAEYISNSGVCASLSHKTVSKWERGESLPDAAQFLLLLRLYRVSDALAVFSERDGAHAGSVPALNDIGRARLVEYLRMLQSTEAFTLAPKKPKPRMIALYELPVSAGTGLFLDSDRYELIETDPSVPEEATFAVRISGDSMQPRYLDREIVYVRETPVLEKGECGVFVLNGDAYMKLLGGEDETELISINKKYPPIRVRENDELRVVGKVVS